MNDSQTIFSVFYAVLYGSMLSSAKDLRLFPWGYIDQECLYFKKILRNRLISSMIVFNLFPFILFASIYCVLDYICNKQLKFLGILFIGISSLSIFSVYRLWHFLMVFCKDKYLLYDYHEYQDIKKERRMLESKIGHFCATIFYLLTILPMILYIICI